MRSIKFRVWNKYRNAWDYSFVIDSDGALWFRTGAGNEYCETMNRPSDDMMLDLEVVQFTGLLDCDGEEIYEGDIISALLENRDGTHSKVNYTIAWTDGGFCVSPRGFNLSDVKNNIRAEFKVIGNRFASPELLEMK